MDFLPLAVGAVGNILYWGYVERTNKQAEEKQTKESKNADALFFFCGCLLFFVLGVVS